MNEITKGFYSRDISIIKDSPSVEKLDSDEIKVDGLKYDIIKTEFKDGHLYFYCLCDEKENNLFVSLVNHVDSNSCPASAEPVKNIIKNLMSDILLLSDKSVRNNISEINFASPVPGIYPFPFVDIPTPPPES